MKALALEQSLPMCCSLAILGGILEVAATAVTAVPSVRKKEGIAMKWWVQWLAIAGNVALQAVGSLFSHLVATWYGPVSLVVPFFYSATLLSNMMIFGLLGERFTKNMRVGTYVIVVAVILLPMVGPDIQEGQNISSLMSHFYSIAWFVVLLVACAVTGLLLLVCDISQYQIRYRVAILLVARAASISVNLTVSRAFVLGLNDALLAAFIIIKVVSGAIYTYAIVVQSVTVEQASFVPLNATTIIIVNALTGIVIWEDWRVVSSWYGYGCIFILLGLGCDLLLSVPLLNAENPAFGATKQASLIISTAKKSRRLYPKLRVSTSCSSLLAGDENGGSTVNDTIPVSRLDAWKQLVSPMEYTPATLSENHDAASPFAAGRAPAETPPPYGSVYTTPQRPGTTSLETTSLLSHHQPTRLGGKLAEAAKTDTITPPHQQLSRLAAWRQTLSPNPNTPRRESPTTTS